MIRFFSGVLICAVSALLSFNAWSFSGGIVGNSADDVVKSQIWFLGNDRVQICVEQGKEFPLDLESSKAEVLKAFAAWQYYTENKRLQLSWPKDIPYLNFNVEMMSSCTGSEDVHFYLGLQNAKILKVAENYIDAQAFSHLDSYDAEKGRGKGFVWVKADQNWQESLWSPRAQIAIYFMHEIGHLYGNDHVAGTIMRENISAYIHREVPENMPQETAEAFPWSVDNTRELYFERSRGVMALHKTVLAPTASQIEIFKQLLGRAPSAPILMGFVQGSESQMNGGNLYMSDESGETLPEPILINPIMVEGGQHYVQTNKLAGAMFLVKLDQGSLLDFSSSDNKIFRYVWKNTDSSFSVPGFLIQGVIIKKDAAHTEIPFTYARNRGDNEYVRLYFKDAGGTHELFRAFLFGQPRW